MFAIKKSGMARVNAVTEKFESMVKEIEQGLIEMFEEKMTLNTQIEDLKNQVTDINCDITAATRSLDKFKTLV